MQLNSDANKVAMQNC